MKTGLTEIVLVIDRSGSMQTTRTDAEGGLRQFISDQKQAPGEAVVTLFRFDDQIDLVVDAKPIGAVEGMDLTIEPRGSTALWAAMLRAINHVGERLSKTPEEERPERVVVATITDGMENRSHQYEVTCGMLKEAVTRQQEQYGWHFVFIGAGQDAILAAANMGIPAATAASYAANAAGTQATYSTVSANLTSLRSGATRSMAFTQRDRDSLLDKGAK